MSHSKTCPNCEQGDLKVFFEVEGVPVHSVLLMPTREIAMGFPRGDIALGYCAKCGFISNTVFDPTVHNYSAQYEETQGFSPTFQQFHRKLAAELIEKYKLRDKKVIEIGCGKGEFISLLCEMGPNSGIGFDPAFVSDRNPAPEGAEIEFVTDFYGEKYAHVHGDFVCCKMTLEHIPDTARFLRTVRRSMGDRFDSVVFFQVPDMPRVLRDVAFWDIYYEHCSYFSAESLTYLFRETGFDVLEVWTDYDDQYLMIAARPSRAATGSSAASFANGKDIAAEIEYFTGQQKAMVEFWKRKLGELRRRGERAVVWGSGSKGVAFLTSLGLNGPESGVEYVVDINPFRVGKFMAGAGQEIVSPAFLKEYKPDLAVVMNPIYCPEIKAELVKMGLDTEVVSV